MNVSTVLAVLGRLSVMLGLLLLVPFVDARLDATAPPDVATAFLVSAIVAAGLGLVLLLSFGMDRESFGHSEAFAVVNASWLLFMVLGALPFVLSGQIPSMLDACFETLSGFTTTGASILPDPARLARPLLLWRALTHWIGGMGIVALSIAILPALGAGGNILFQAEIAGPQSEKLLPRISSTAKLLWGIYVALTAAEVVALRLAGMGTFDAVCHAFATVSTGGFSTRAESIGAFGPAIQWIVIVFMILGGTNFVLLYAAARGRPRDLLRNTEARVFALILLGAIAVIVGYRLAHGEARDGLGTLVRDAVFSVTTLITTTGFVTADYDRWAPILHLVLVALMISGACSGSTSGGAKVARLVLWGKAAARECKRLLRPSGVFAVRVGGRAMPEAVVSQAQAFLVVYLITLALGTQALVGLGIDLETSFSAAVTCMSGVGPGLGGVGPTQTYAPLPDAGKGVLMALMLLGRLEFMSAIVLFRRELWRR